MNRRRSTYPGIFSKDTTDQEFHERLQSLKIPIKEILGKNYKAKKRHKTPPTNIKQKMVQTQCVAYASLPYSELQVIPDIPTPTVVAKRHLEKPLQIFKQDTARLKPGFRNRREGSVFQNGAFTRRQSILKR